MYVCGLWQAACLISGASGGRKLFCRILRSYSSSHEDGEDMFPPKSQFAFNGVEDFISQEIVAFTKYSARNSVDVKYRITYRA
jgi:hypothetical protein